MKHLISLLNNIPRFELFWYYRFSLQLSKFQYCYEIMRKYLSQQKLTLPDLISVETILHIQQSIKAIKLSLLDEWREKKSGGNYVSFIP